MYYNAAMMKKYNDEYSQFEPVVKCEFGAPMQQYVLAPHPFSLSKLINSFFTKCIPYWHIKLINK